METATPSRFAEHEDSCTQNDPTFSQMHFIQPEEEEKEEEILDSTPWGRLISFKSDIPQILLYHIPENESKEKGKVNLYTLGRSNKCSLKFDYSPRISNNHCSIYCQENRVDSKRPFLEAWIEDKSANGTFLNRKIRLKKNVPRLLRSGDQISLVNPDLVKILGPGVITQDDVARCSFTVLLELPLPPVGFLRNILHVSNNNSNRVLTRSTTVMRMLNKERNVEDFYEFKEVLGTGTSAQVYHGIQKDTGKSFAVKVIDQRKLSLEGASLEEITKEAELLRSLRHPCIIQLEDIFSYRHNLFLIMELSKGGDLFDRIAKKTRYLEEEACFVMIQILQAIDYLHENKVAHRDLKPENILLVRADDDVTLKITDFGLAKKLDSEKGEMKTFCGTPQYFAPEVLQRQNTVCGQGTYSLAADMWSIGVILFVLLAGEYPFKEQSLNQQISKADYSFNGKVWLKISKEAKQLIQDLLIVDPLKRLTAASALKSIWIQNGLIKWNEINGITVTDSVSKLTLIDTEESKPSVSPLKNKQKRKPQQLNPPKPQKRVKKDVKQPLISEVLTTIST